MQQLGRWQKGPLGPAALAAPPPAPLTVVRWVLGASGLPNTPPQDHSNPCSCFCAPPTPGHVHGAYVRYKQKNQWHRAPHWVRVGTQNALRLGSEGPGAALFPRVNMTTVS